MVYFITVYSKLNDERCVLNIDLTMITVIADLVITFSNLVHIAWAELSLKSTIQSANKPMYISSLSI